MFAVRSADRNAVWIGPLLIVCAAAGTLSGADPKLGVEFVLGIAFVGAVLASLNVGLFLFTVLGFLEVIQFQGAALSFIKIAGLVLFVSWFATASTQTRNQTRSLISSHPLFCSAVIALIGWSAISVAWAESTGTAISSTDRYLLNALLLPIVYGAIRRRDQLRWFLAAFVIGAVVSALYGFIQSAGVRLSGGIGDPNEEAAVLVAAIALAIGLIGSSRPRSAVRVWCYLAIFICAAGIVNTASRGGLVAAACVLVAAVVFGGRWRMRAAAALLVAVVATGAYFVVIAPLSARQRITSSSTTGRSDLWTVGFRMFKANPITGVGSGEFAVAAIHYLEQPGALPQAGLIVDVPHAAHDVFLQVLDELGIPGLIAFVLVAAASIGIGVRAVREFERLNDPELELIARVTVLALIGLLSADIFLSGEWSKQLWLLLALPPTLSALANAPL
jgi:O-antigen ligase